MVKQIFDNLLRKITIKKVMLLLLILYIAPTFINYDFNTENRFVGTKISLPYLYAGDQVHYYILSYSLLKDKDYDVRNNYDNSEFNNTYDIGYLFRGRRVFREAGYFNFKNRDYKSMWIENTTENIKAFGEIKVFEGLNYFERPDPGKEYGMIMVRPWGMPLFYYILLLPFSFAPNPEPLVIFLSVFLVLLGIYFFYLTLNYFLKDRRISLFFTFLLGVSSELWMYSKIFYPDVLQFFLLSLITYLFIVKKNNLFTGILFAAGIFARPTFIILLPFFVIYRLLNLDDYSSFGEVKCKISCILGFDRIKRLFILLLPVFFILAVQLYSNYYFFGGMLSNPNSFALHFYNPLEGLWVSFFKISRGLFVFSPILIFTFFGLKSFYNKHKIDSIFIYLMSSSFILFLSSMLVRGYFMDTYSIRYYVPIMHFFFIPMAFWYKEITHNKKTVEKNKIWIGLFYVAMAISVIINLQAAIFHTLIWSGPPWKIVTLLIENWGRISIFP